MVDLFVAESSVLFTLIGIVETILKFVCLINFVCVVPVTVGALKTPILFIMRKYGTCEFLLFSCNQLR